MSLDIKELRRISFDWKVQNAKPEDIVKVMEALDKLIEYASDEASELIDAVCDADWINFEPDLRNALFKYKGWT